MSDPRIIHAPVNQRGYAVTTPITQYDYGYLLLPEGVELPATYEIDFSNDEKHGTSLIVYGDSEGAEVPEELIRTGKDVYAFYYHVGDGYGKTEFTWKIPNRCRPSRDGETPTPSQQSSIDQAISALNEAKEEWEGMTAEAVTLPPNSQATAEYADGVLTIGVPRGADGGGASSGLSGKKVVFLGDSIGYGEGNNGHSFVDIIREKGICSSVIKECHSSATVGPYQPWSEAEGYDCIAMIQAQSTNISNADIVFIEYGGNDTYAIDHNLVTLGTINDAASTNSFFGYCRRAIQNIRAINPTVEIYWLFPIMYNLPLTPLASYANGDWMTVTSKAITQVCDDCGVSYYGLYSDLNPVKGAGHIINDAAGHPSEAGHAIIAENVIWGYPYHAFPYRPSRSITLASDGTYDSTFRVLVALLQVGVDVDIRYDGLIFHPQKSDSSYIVFSAVTASGTTETEYVLVVNSSGTSIYSTTRTLTNIPWGGGGGGDDPTPPDPTGYETIYDGNVNVKSSSPNYFQINNVSAVPQQSETWRITWKGVTAEFTSVYNSQINTYYVGNPVAIGGTDDGSGVPVVIYGSTSVQITGVTSDNAGTAAIKIERGTAS